MEPLTGVGQTALGVARVRAAESRRPDRLFDDPFAQAFIDAAPEIARPTTAPGADSLGARLAFSIVIRTRFFDDYLLAAAAAGIRQVCLVAAGLDARAFRLAWPTGVRLFELDLPETLAFKERVLGARGAVPTGERVAVGVDLREDWPPALTAAGFDASAPTAWLVEGLLIYLSADEAAGLLTTIGALSAAGSQLSFEHRNNVDDDFLARVRAAPGLERYTRLFKGGLREDAREWLDRNGWRARATSRDVAAESYGRTPSRPVAGAFITARRAA